MWPWGIAEITETPTTQSVSKRHFISELSALSIILFKEICILLNKANWRGAKERESWNRRGGGKAWSIYQESTLCQTFTQWLYTQTLLGENKIPNTNVAFSNFSPFTLPYSWDLNPSGSPKDRNTDEKGKTEMGGRRKFCIKRKLNCLSVKPCPWTGNFEQVPGGEEVPRCKSEIPSD